MAKNQKENPTGGNHYEENHINNVETYAPNAEKVENNHTHTVTVQINISLSFHFHTAIFTKLFNALTGNLGLFCTNLRDTHFDGEGQSGVPVYELTGTPAEIVQALRLLKGELEEDTAVSVRYISRANRFDRSHLSLLQAIRIAENESRL